MKRKYENLTTTSVCPHCEKEFTAPTRFAQKYCSRQCKFDAAKKREQRACIICGNPFTVRLSSKVKVCSQGCKHKLIARSNTDESTHVTSICPACQKSFTYYTNWPRKYCCKACAATAAVTNIKHFAPSSYTATCLECGIEFKTTSKRTKGRFCSRSCWGKWQSVHRVGEANPRFGKKLGRPSSLPPLPTKTCPICEKTFSVKVSHFKRRRCCSKICYAQWQTLYGPTGENHPTWLGGYEPYYGPNWRSQRQVARERDGKCIDCGITPEKAGRRLDVHHIIPFRKFGLENYEKANSLSNLVTLCNKCHLKREWLVGDRKRKRYSTNSP